MAVSDAQFEHCRAMLPRRGAGGRGLHRRRLDARHRPDLRRRRQRAARRGVDWRFNAWGGTEGGLYFPWDRDDRVAAKVLEIEGADRYRAPIVLEGGSIHVDGEGTVLTHRRVPAEPQPQPRALARADRAGAAATTSAPRRWSGSARASSTTRPTATSTTSPASPGPGSVLLTWTDDESDPQHAISRDALAAAAKRRPTPAAARSRSIKLPSPARWRSPPRRPPASTPSRARLPRRAGDRLAASYVNFYIANSRIVFPLLDERHDERGGGDPARLLPRARGGRRPRPRDPARRRQHPLHHPAGPSPRDIVYVVFAPLRRRSSAAAT